ncbi:MAG: hypothetical protein R3281_11695 [Balneolaceae bacterium]|nr:hypothetical protein [Balneolaceae bacterium]
MVSLEKIAFLFSYGFETIRSFIQAEELIIELVLTVIFWAFLFWMVSS